MSTPRKTKNPHIGSSFDDFLKEEGIFEEVQTQALKEVAAWRVKKAKKSKRTPRKGGA